MGIFPRNDNMAVMPEIEGINANLARMADGRKVRYLNINDQLADHDGRLHDGMMNARDKLHPGAAGVPGLGGCAEADANGIARAAGERRPRASAHWRSLGAPVKRANYSVRSASVGFTPEARCAGMRAAQKPAEPNSRMAMAVAAGSESFTS